MSAPPSDRQALEEGDEQWIRREVDMLHRYSCFKQVWTPASEMDEVVEDLMSEPGKSCDYERMTANRRKTCFFRPYTLRMSLEAAVELERRENDRRPVKWSIIAGLIGVVVGAILCALLK